MKSIGYAISLVVALSVAVLVSGNAIAHECPVYPAACNWDVDGVSFPDSDCDHVYDHDELCGSLDNCKFTKNGRCDSDPLDCDIDENGTMSEREQAAGHQADWNDNGIGDACDDTDGDGVVDYLDNCKITPNPIDPVTGLQDAGVCTDTDGDWFEDEIDNCPTRYNIPQEDTDEDGVGDVCDICRFDANPLDASGMQDASACPEAGNNPSGGDDPNVGPDGSQNPAESTGGRTTSDSTFKQGTGGCSIAAAGSSAAPITALLMTLSTLAIAIIKSK
jgi:Thrombospondin type 3 repeat